MNSTLFGDDFFQMQYLVLRIKDYIFIELLYTQGGKRRHKGDMTDKVNPKHPLSEIPTNTDPPGYRGECTCRRGTDYLVRRVRVSMAYQKMMSCELGTPGKIWSGKSKSKYSSGKMKNLQHLQRELTLRVAMMTPLSNGWAY
jgi:hypothetical protein